VNDLFSVSGLKGARNLNSDSEFFTESQGLGLGEDIHQADALEGL